MNTKINTIDNKRPRTNKTTTTVVTGLVTLILGIMIGGAGAENGTGLVEPTLKAQPLTNQTRPDLQLSSLKGYPGYSLSFDVRDLKDRYVVQADLPDTDAPDVQVSLKSGQTLNFDVSPKRTQSSNQKNVLASATEFSQYVQMIQLPTPVKADQMKIQRENHELIITIPKTT